MKQPPGDLEKVRGVVVGVIRATLAFLVLLVVLRTRAVAGTRVELLNNFYSQFGSGGKQVYDGSGNESLTVFEPVLFVDSALSSETTLSARALVDTWSGASDRLFDSTTGASGRKSHPSKNRQDIDLSLSQKVGEFTLIPALGYSTSLPYQSINGGIGIEKGFAEDNFTVNLTYHRYQDKVKGFDFTNKVLTDWNPRVTDSVDLGASQILSPVDIVYFGLGLTRQTGVLSTNINTVSLNGVRVPEVLPSDRNKKIASGRLVHGFTDQLAGHLDYRYYKDDWDVSAHSVEPSLAFSNEEDTNLLRVFYRYHQQSGTSYYADQFTTSLKYMTSDSDLAPLTANEFGAQGSLRFDIKGIEYLQAGAGLVYYTRSNDLGFLTGQLSLSVAF